MAEQIRSADAVLFFSPEYNIGIISASTGKLGGARMQYYLRQIGVFLDMRFLNRPEVMISEAQKKLNAQGELTDEDTRKFLKVHFEAFEKFVRSNRG